MESYNMNIDEMASPQKPVTTQSNDDQVSVIRREFFALTRDPFSAVILNQLLYWTLRVKDFDLYVKEEKTWDEDSGPFQHGWIYKTASDLNEEAMLGISKTTMRKYLKLLIDEGWIEEKINSLDKWNKTTKYRVNIRKLQADLRGIGRQLPSIYLKAFSTALGEKHPHLKIVSCNENTSNIDHLKSEETSKSKFLPSKTENLSSESKFLSSETENLLSKSKFLPSYTYTENTTEITNREHTHRTRVHEDFDKNFFEEVIGAWKTPTAQEVHLTEERKQKLQSILSIHFQSDLAQWQQFCERVSRSPFLMGQGVRRWRVSLDWILIEENLLKILEGNFDDGNLLEQKADRSAEKTREKEIKAVLESIEDPVWKKWCSQLNFSSESHNYVSLLDLKTIANVKFLEVEDDRLVWVGSFDAHALSKIEDFRLKLLPIVQGTFPHARTMRTRLSEERTVIPEPHTLISRQYNITGGEIHA